MKVLNENVVDGQPLEHLSLWVQEPTLDMYRAIKHVPHPTRNSVQVLDLSYSSRGYTVAVSSMVLNKTSWEDVSTDYHHAVGTAYIMKVFAVTEEQARHLMRQARKLEGFIN